MKKRIMGLAVLVATVVCLTGCGGTKKLVCTMQAGFEDVELVSTFEGNKVTDMSFNAVMDLSSYSDAQVSAVEKQDLCKTMESSMPYKFSTCDQSTSDKTIKVTGKVNMDEISEAEKTSSPEDAKKDLEKQGYSCEIK